MSHQSISLLRSLSFMLLCFIATPLSALHLNWSPNPNLISTLPNQSPSLILETRTQSMLRQMHNAYDHYVKLAESAPWPTIKRGPLLRFGDEHDQVPLIRKRLIQLGDLSAEDCELESRLFDVDLHDAVERFQQRHGEKIDGIVGPGTRYQLNIKPKRRADQILVNIYRISEFEFGLSPYIQVNVPEYKLRLFQNGQSILEMKTIVGRKKRKTPIFSTEINRVVVNPSWHVPKSIAYKDIVPELEKDPNYLRKLNLKLVVGWGKKKQELDPAEIDLEKLYKGKNYQRFWEPPSERNTLGSVKFLTNGQFSVYLHDTSAKRLFSNPHRAFSSGCVRVEKPRLLADSLMEISNQRSAKWLDKHFEQEETRHLRLHNPIKLHMTYWTSWIDENGLLNFRSDLYKRDRYELSQLKQASAQEIFMTSN